MSAKDKKKKDKQGKPLPKINVEANRPRPKPISWNGPSDILERAREFPILGCWFDSEAGEHGLIRVVVARQVNEESVLYGVYLVDRLCLGVKNCDWKAGISQNALKRMLPQLSGSAEPCEVDYAHQLIYGSIEYARRYGFEPHPDFKQAGLVLDPPDAHPRRHYIEFGREGKPFFVSGPNDKPRWVINTLMRTAGEGNFDYLIGLNSPDEI
jgi:hypothetical protein